MKYRRAFIATAASAVLGAALILVALSGSGGDRPTVITGAPSDPPRPTIPVTAPIPSATGSIVATAKTPSVAIYRSPTSAEPFTSLANPIPSGGPLVFLVESLSAQWLQVMLPLRPNGSLGWVRQSDVNLSQHRFRIEVHLADYRLELYNDDTLAHSFPIGIAKDNTPTPGGKYYTTELLQPPDPNSVYGRYAYGLSGFSEVLTTFNGGPGQLGIHGTNDPNSIGTKASSGCIRLLNDDVATLAATLPLGVPVVVRP